VSELTGAGRQLAIDALDAEECLKWIVSVASAWSQPGVYARGSV
jgi:hypothetical protein